MKNISELQERQDIAFNILKKFDAFCRHNHLRYMVCGGTLIGAIRHHGFIPWDDDIDVLMPRRDYEKMIENDGISDFYKIINYTKNKDCYFPFTKIIDNRTVLIEEIDRPFEIGVFIDVFPMDGMPEKESEQTKHLSNLKKYKNLLTYNVLPFKRGKSIISTIFKYVALIYSKTTYSRYYLNKKINDLATKYDFDCSKYVAGVTSGYGKSEVTLMEECTKYIEVDFEGIKVFAPSNYDEYLRGIYGDYMTLPPKEKRVSPHLTKTYWK